MPHYDYPSSSSSSSSSSYDSAFDVQVRVRRSFSFEELQSGSFLASLDDSDLQFYRVYGQPVLIPDEVDANFVVHTDFACPISTKSYTLQNPLGDPTVCQTAYDWQLVKQEPVEAYPNPALPAISCHLYTIADQDDDVVSPMDDRKPMPSLYDEPPPMDSLPYPPPANSASPPYFQVSQDGGALGFHGGREEWEDASTRAHRFGIASESYTLSELASPVAGSVGRTHRRRSRSPTPRCLSPAPHSKRSLDKKPALACLFCRGRKIACGPPQPGSKDKTCNQCARRHLKCEYPLESRRGMRKRRSLVPRISSEDGSRVSLVKASRKRPVVDKSSSS